MNRVVIRACSHKTLTSDAIALFQRNPFPTHMEAVMPDGSGWIGSQAPDGVLIRPVRYDSEIVYQEQFFELPDMSEVQVERFYDFMYAQIGKPYAYNKIVTGLILNRSWRSGKDWFCDELLAAACEHANWFKLVTECDHLTPYMLYLIYSGRFNIPDIY